MCNITTEQISNYLFKAINDSDLSLIINGQKISISKEMAQCLLLNIQDNIISLNLHSFVIQDISVFLSIFLESINKIQGISNYFLLIKLHIVIDAIILSKSEIPFTIYFYNKYLPLIIVDTEDKVTLTDQKLEKSYIICCSNNHTKNITIFNALKNYVVNLDEYNACQEILKQVHSLIVGNQILNMWNNIKHPIISNMSIIDCGKTLLEISIERGSKITITFISTHPDIKIDEMSALMKTLCESNLTEFVKMYNDQYLEIRINTSEINGKNNYVKDEKYLNSPSKTCTIEEQIMQKFGLANKQEPNTIKHDDNNFMKKSLIVIIIVIVCTLLYMIYVKFYLCKDKEMIDVSDELSKEDDVFCE